MTREKLWKIVTKLVWYDYWNGESEPSEEIKEILTNSLLIPKPKFKVGDVVKCKDGSYWDISEHHFNPHKNEWVYSAKVFERKFYESELELGQEGKGK